MAALRSFGFFICASLPALVSAACSVSATTTLQATGDASAFSSCATFTGSIAIATGVTGQIVFNGPKRLTGNFVADSSDGLTSLSSDTLQTIDDALELQNLKDLDTVSFPQLSTVNTIKWSDLPSLQRLELTAGLRSVDTIDIRNTALLSLMGILQTRVAKSVYIANNPSLTSLELQLDNSSTAVTVADNSDALALSFPNLAWCNNVTLRNVASVQLPVLTSINGSSGVYNGRLTEFKAPILQAIEGSLVVTGNTLLSNISLPKLRTVGGGFQVANNTAIDRLEFDSLQTVSGAVSFSGNFSKVSLAGLKQVAGAVQIQSSADISEDCEAFNKIRSSVVRGKFVCSGRVSSATTTVNGTTPTSNSTANASASGAPAAGPKTGDMSSGAKAGIGVGVAAAVSISIITLSIWLRRRRARQHTLTPGAEKADMPAELSDAQRLELHDDTKESELATGHEAQEMPSGQGMSELEADVPPVELPASPFAGDDSSGYTTSGSERYLIDVERK